MKRTCGNRPVIALLGLLAAGLTTLCQAATTNFIVAQFDTDTSGTFANLGWGFAYPSIIWDSTVNKTTTLGPNTAGSGSVQWTVDWSGTASGDQVMVNYRFPNSAVLDLVGYTNISFDIRFSPTSTTDGAGYFGRVELDWTPQSEGWPSTPVGAASFFATNSNWIHVEIPFDATSVPKLAAVTHVGFKIQQNATGAPLPGAMVFWLDNVILHARAATVPPPTMSLTPVTTPPGLMVIAPGAGNGYRRGMVRTLDPISGWPAYSWLGYGNSPVTYSLTITNYPKDHYYFQSEIFLVQNGGNDSSVDYSAATVAALDIRNQPDGSATAVFRYKTNHVSANASDYQPATISCASGVLGTWSLTFLNDTNVTVTAPNGASTNFALPMEAVQEFYNPVSVYFGNQQNGTGNAGQASVYSRVKITGVTMSPEIDDTFPGPGLNPDPLNIKWRAVGEVPSCIFVLRPDHKWWANWTLPATGFSLQASPDLSPGSWGSNDEWTNVVNTSFGNRVPISTGTLPSTAKSFFRLSKSGP